MLRSLLSRISARSARPRQLAIDGLDASPEAVRAAANPRGPNQLWIADVAFVRTGEGWLYLAAALDCYSRRCLGWQLRDQLGPELLTKALGMATAARWPSIGLSLEPGRLNRDIPLALGRRCREAGIAVPADLSISALDAAVSENFFATLRGDLTDASAWRSRGTAATAIADWIEQYYNPQAKPPSRRSDIAAELDELSL